MTAASEVREVTLVVGFLLIGDSTRWVPTRWVRGVEPVGDGMPRLLLSIVLWSKVTVIAVNQYIAGVGFALFFT